jgi:hypothetical protein
MPGMISSKPSVSAGDWFSDSQKEGDSDFSGLNLYKSCALRRKYMVRGFCNIAMRDGQKCRMEYTYNATFLESVSSE